jgi:2-octaprenyl-6-methoxyphenol hydroxylase
MSAPIIIVGGGPVGATLALLLAKLGINVTVLETRKAGAAHGENRALALSYGSQRILDKLGLWGALAAEATAINTIHVSQKGSIGRTQLHATDYKQDALGYVLSYGALSAALDVAVSKLDHSHDGAIHYLFEASAESITHTETEASVRYKHDGAMLHTQAPLVVLADGGRSLDAIAGLTRQTKEYGHDALITKVRAELPHNNVAYERFTAQGPMALLPNGQHDFSLVWTGKKSYIEPIMNLNDAEFLAQFHAQFGDRVGTFLSVEKRMSFPLKLSQLQANNTEMSATPHLVVIGNAAQTMHPVAGQGFNVGLRDAESLALHIASATTASLGSAAMLGAYQASRKQDTKGGLLFTDFLVNLFSNDILGISALRGAGLGLLDTVPPLKQFLVRKMSFGK